MRVDFYSFNIDAPPGFNLGVACLSEEIKQRGHEVRVSHVDDQHALAWDLPALVERAAAFAPDVIAVSFATNHAALARELTAALSQRLPDAKTVLGGVHVTFAPEEVLAWPGVTAVGRGECDGVLADLVDRWAAGDEAPSVPNFWIRRGDGSVVRNPMGPLPQLEGISAFNEDIDVPTYTRAGRGFGHVAVTRGCPYRCAYCFNKGIVDRYATDLGVSPGKVRYMRRRSVDDAIAEVQRLRRLAKGELRVINFDDDTLVANRSWFLDFSRRLKEEVGLPYVTNATVDRIDAEIASALADTGCLLVKFGIESGSARVCRDVLQRVQSLERAERAFLLLREAGVNTRAYVMMALPTETIDEGRQTFDFCGQIRADTVRPSWFQPYPGTVLRDLCIAEGLIEPDQPLEPEPKESPLRLPAEHAFALRKIASLYTLLLSAAVPDSSAAAEYTAVVDEVMAMSPATFDDPATRARLRMTALELDRRLRREGVPHYINPFPDRLDAAFLVGQPRRHPFPNIDDAWPLDAPWRDEPLP